MQRDLCEFDSAGEAARVLGEQIIQTLQDALASRGAASLLVPGGRTPLPLFQMLRESALDWSRVVISLTDERWVGEAHAGSNAALLRRELLSARAGCARFIPLFDGSDSAAAAAHAIWRSLGHLPRPVDAVVLGMGDDGHFASLFPGNTDLGAALDPAGEPACVAMRAPVEPHERISLNLAALLQARRMFLFVTGEKKKAVLQAAAHAAPEQLPVAALLRQKSCPVEIYWSP